MTQSNADSTSDASVSGAGADEKLVTMLTNRLNEMQTDLKKSQDDVTSSTRSAQQASQFGAISTKQDVGADEAQSAGVALASNNASSLSNFLGWQAARFADRDRVHFDNMQAATAVVHSNLAFSVALLQSLAGVAAVKIHGSE